MAAGWTANTSENIIRLNGSGQKVGPGRLLKVMAGDLINAKVDYYHNFEPLVNNTGSTIGNAVINVLAGMISASSSAAGMVKSNAASIGNQLSSQPTLFTSQVSPDIASSGSILPKAYLYVAFFDERFRFVPEASQSIRVRDGGINSMANPLVLPNILAPRNGYCFVYLINESEVNVFFDNLQVRHDRGRIVEENHYYSYGLRIAALSSKAAEAAANRYLYQGDYSEVDEDLGWNDFLLRSYDPQTGRFLQNDPYDQFASGYVGMGADPASMVDPTGGWTGGEGKVPRDGPGRLYASPDAAAWGWARLYREMVMANPPVEWSSAIYEIMFGGVKYYSFTIAARVRDDQEPYRFSPGPFHFRRENRDISDSYDRSDLLPMGAIIVGHIHSHPPQKEVNQANIYLSDPDRENHKQQREGHIEYLYSYLYNFKGELRVWDQTIDIDAERGIGYEGRLIVEGLYHGINSDNLANGGLGTYNVTNKNRSSKEVNINFMGRGFYPKENMQLGITNSQNGQYNIFTDQQVLYQTMSASLKMIAPLTSAIISLSGAINKVKDVLPCPVF